MKYEKWYWNNDSKTALYYLAGYNWGFGYTVGTHTFFERTSVIWDTKTLIPATKQEVLNFLEGKELPLTAEEIEYNIKKSFPNYEKAAKELENLVLNLKEGESIQCKSSRDDIWHRISKDLENFENLKFRIKPNFDHIKRFDAVVVTYKGSSKKFIRVYSGTNVSGDPMVFNDSEDELEVKLTVTSCRKIRT